MTTPQPNTEFAAQQTVTDVLRLAAKSAAPYSTATIGASHLNEAADTIDNLRDQLAEVRKDAELERALRQAAKDLPAHFFISVNVERDAGWVELYGSAGGSIEIAQEDRTLAEQVRAAIDAAKESA